MLIISALLAASAILARIVFSERNMINLYVQKEKAFYIAEDGLEDGRSIIASNSIWFTDNPHSPNDDLNWLINSANGSLKTFGGGSYKIVREGGKNVLYSIGFSRKGKSIMRIKFNISPLSAFDFKIL